MHATQYSLVHADMAHLLYHVMVPHLSTPLQYLPRNSFCSLMASSFFSIFFTTTSFIPCLISSIPVKKNCFPPFPGYVLACYRPIPNRRPCECMHGCCVLHSLTICCSCFYQRQMFRFFSQVLHYICQSKFQHIVYVVICLVHPSSA